MTYEKCYVAYKKMRERDRAAPHYFTLAPHRNASRCATYRNARTHRNASRRTATRRASTPHCTAPHRTGTHRARPIASHLNASSRTTPRRAALAPHRNESRRAAYRTAPERIPPHCAEPRPGRAALVGPISRNWVYQRRHTIHDNISSSSDN